jgi:cell division septation protein DedD
LKLALSHGHAHIAFPALSCGVFGYPLDDAAEAALEAIQEFNDKEIAAKPENKNKLRTVTFVMFEQTTVLAWLDAAQKLGMELVVEASTATTTKETPAATTSSSSSSSSTTTTSPTSSDESPVKKKGIPPPTSGQFMWQVAAQKAKNALSSKSVANVVVAAGTSKS